MSSLDAADPEADRDHDDDRQQGCDRRVDRHERGQHRDHHHHQDDQPGVARARPVDQELTGPRGTIIALMLPYVVFIAIA